MMNLEESERCTVHYQPIAGGTSNTMCTEVVQSKPDGTTVFKLISDSKRLLSSIRYEPDAKSKRISISDRLKDGRHVAPIKVNGTIPWKSPYEIHIYSAGWRTSTDLGHIKANIPGIEGMGDATSPSGTNGKIRFDDSEDVEFSAGYKSKENIPYITVVDHPNLERVEEIVFDDFDWFHDAYPFSGTSVGVRLGFSEEMVCDSINFVGDSEDVGYWNINRQYDEKPSQNPNVSLWSV